MWTDKDGTEYFESKKEKQDALDAPDDFKKGTTINNGLYFRKRYNREQAIKRKKVKPKPPEETVANE